MPRWYFTRRELRQTPSILKGLDPDVESRYRREGARFIMELGTSMNLSLSTTMATAVVFFHRFYMSHSFQDFPRYPISCACLFLAGKVEETPKKCKDMIDSARKLMEDSMFIEQFGRDDKIRIEEIMTLERILLQTIKFDLQLEHPYKFLLKYATSLKGDKTRLEKMVQMAWNFVNDSLCTTLCLQWEPEIMAIALMHLACKLSKFDVSDWSNRTSEHLRWWDMFVEDMTMEVIEDICHQVLDFYAQTQDPVNNQDANKQPTGHSPEINQQNSAPLPQMLHAVPPQFSNQPPPGFNPNLPPPGLMPPMPPMYQTHSSSPIPQINSFVMAPGPMPYFAHQPPPPMVNSPQHPLPPLPKQPPVPPLGMMPLPNQPPLPM